MFRKIGLATFIILTALFSHNALSITERALAPNMNYELKPNIPEILKNFTFFKINASCVLSIENTTASISVMASKKPCKLDGNSLPLNEKTTLEVKDKAILHIIAEPGAEVELTNLDNALIVATCSLNSPF